MAKSKVISREIPLFNHGSKAGDFKIKYSGDKPIAIIPSAGSIPAKSVQLIKVGWLVQLQIFSAKLNSQLCLLTTISGNKINTLKR